MSRYVRSKLLAVLSLGLVMALATACGGDATSTPTQASGNTPTPTTATSEGDTPEPTATTAAPDDFDAEAYFRGKTIQLVSISPPGGGTDAQSRVLAALYGKFIPGNPRISVSNIARVAGYNYMYNADPDGYTLMYKASPGFERQLSPDAEFKLRDFPLIAAVGISPPIWVSTDEVPYDTLSEAIGQTGFTFRMAEAVGTAVDLTGNPLTATFLCDRLQLECDHLAVAEAGTDSQMLMFDRGEINSNLRGSLWWNLATLRPGAVGAGEYKGLTAAGNPALGVPPHPEVDVEIGHAYDLLTSQEDKDDFALISYPAALFNKALAGPPGLPDHLIAVFEQAFRDALEDEEFVTTLSDVTSLDVANDTVFREDIEPVFQDTYDRFFGNQDRYAQLQEELYPYWE